MKISAMVRYSEVLEALGVASIAGSLFSDVDDLVEFLKVDVDDHQAKEDLLDREIVKVEETIYCSRCEECEDEPDYTPPQPHYLAEWVAAIAAGDTAMAMSLASIVFEDAPSQVAAEQALRALPLNRRAA